MNVDRLPPFSYLIFPNQPDLELQIDTTAAPSSLLADHQLVEFATMEGSRVYAHGSTTFSGTQQVNINNTAINVQNASGGSLTVAGTVNIGNTPNVAVTSGTVNIGNTPTVAIASNQSVNIAGTPAVTIQNTPAVNVANTSIPIANANGTTLNVAGQVNIGNTPTVTVGNTIQANINSGTVNATIQNASLNSNVTNNMISTTNSKWASGVKNSVTNLANGATLSMGDLVIPIAIYDGFHVFLTSSNGYHNSYDILTNASGAWLSDGIFVDTSGVGIDPSPYTSVGSASPTTLPRINNIYYGFISISPASPFNVVSLNIKNTSGATIVSDTVQLWVCPRLASTQVSNTTSSPANMQQSAGSFDTQAAFDSQPGTGLGGNALSSTLISSGGYIKKLSVHLAPNTGNTTTFYTLANGGSVFDRGAVQTTGAIDKVLDFGAGVPNNGISITVSSTNTATIVATGYGVTTTQPVGNPRTATTV